MIRRLTTILTAASLLLLTACVLLGPGLEPAYVPPSEIQSVREAALEHIRTNYPDAGLPADLSWAGANTTPRDLVGGMYYAFASGEWYVTIEHGMVAPEDMEYHVAIRNVKSEFNWIGTIKPDGQVLDPNLVATPQP